MRRRAFTAWRSQNSDSMHTTIIQAPYMCGDNRKGERKAPLRLLPLASYRDCRVAAWRFQQDGSSAVAPFGTAPVLHLRSIRRSWRWCERVKENNTFRSSSRDPATHLGVSLAVSHGMASASFGWMLMRTSIRLIPQSADSSQGCHWP